MKFDLTDKTRLAAYSYNNGTNYICLEAKTENALLNRERDVSITLHGEEFIAFVRAISRLEKLIALK
jgi:hypothetical protein